MAGLLSRYRVVLTLIGIGVALDALISAGIPASA